MTTRKTKLEVELHLKTAGALRALTGVVTILEKMASAFQTLSERVELLRAEILFAAARTRTGKRSRAQRRRRRPEFSPADNPRKKRLRS